MELEEDTLREFVIQNDTASRWFGKAGCEITNNELNVSTGFHHKSEGGGDSKEKRVGEAKKLLRHKGDSGANGVAIHIKNGEPLKIQSGPCHGFIRQDGSESSVAIVSRIVREEGDYGSNQSSISKALPVYYDWLFNRSPWAFCYESKDANQALEEKCCVLRVDVPANMLQGALISTRHTWEYADNVMLWYKLTQKHGVEENVAFVAAFCVSYSGGREEIAIRATGGDHIAISPGRMSFEGLRAFIDGKPLYTTGLYKDGGHYRGVTKAFGDTEANQGEFFRNMLSDFETFTTATSLLKLNPFEKAKEKANGDRRVMNVKTYAAFVKQKIQGYVK